MRSYAVDTALSFVAIDNLSDFLADSEVLGLWAAGLKFRIDQYRELWPAMSWVEGADLFACHFFVMLNGNIVGAARLSSFVAHSKQDTFSSYESLIDAQREPIKSHLKRQLEAASARPDFQEFAEYGKLVVEPSLRATRLGLRYNVRDHLLDFVVHAGRKLGYLKYLTVTHEELNTHKFSGPMGFVHYDDGHVLELAPGTTGRLCILEDLDANYVERLEAKKFAFDTQGIIYSKRSAPSWKKMSGTISPEITTM
jgi:hypothetical protein